jgi:hypothetical protein
MKKPVVLAAVALAFAASAVADGPEPAKKVEKWEYAKLHFRAGKTQGYAKWVTSRTSTEAKDWEGLAAKLKAPAAVKDATEETHQLRVLDALGAQGWELVLERLNSAYLTEVSTFKRRTPAK